MRQFDSDYWQRVERGARLSRRRSSERSPRPAGSPALIPERVRRRRDSASPKRRSFSRRSTAPAPTPARATRRCTSWARCCGTARAEQKQRYLPRIAVGRAAPAVVRGDRAHDGHRHHAASRRSRVRKGDRYVVNGQKVWISRVQHSDLMLLLARTTPLAEREEEVRGAVGLSRRAADASGRGHDGATDPQHGQPRDQRGLLRQLRGSGREPDRRGRARASATSSTA